MNMQWKEVGVAIGQLRLEGMLGQARALDSTTATAATSGVSGASSRWARPWLEGFNAGPGT